MEANESPVELASVPGPEVLKRTAVADADTPCPACGAVAWDQVEVRTEPNDEYYRRRGVMCRVCGLAPLGWRDFGRRRPGRTAHSIESALPETAWPSEGTVLQHAGFPVYGLPDARGVDARISRYGGDPAKGTIYLVDVRHRSVDDKWEIVVTSSVRDDGGEFELIDSARRSLASALWDPAFGDRELWALSEEARDLRLEVLREEAEQRSDSAETTILRIPVNEAEIDFIRAADPGGTWAAAANVDGVEVRITGLHAAPPPSRLVPLDDTP